MIFIEFEANSCFSMITQMIILKESRKRSVLKFLGNIFKGRRHFASEPLLLHSPVGEYRVL